MTNQEYKLKIILDGKTTNIKALKSKTIIESAEEAGLDPPFSCGKGFCTSCVAVITEGKAEMKENTTLDEDEITSGKILTCVAHAITEQLQVNYDL
jgi:ring-1,2-phenylacetyl-CoA epoxidase subunit PaaE